MNNSGRRVQWAILILGVILIVNLGNNVVRLVNSGQRLVDKQKELADTEKQNQELKARLAEVKTTQFKEKEAREKLGYGKPGEIVLVIPPEDQITNRPTSPEASLGASDPNWVKWRKLYLGF